MYIIHTYICVYTCIHIYLCIYIHIHLYGYVLCVYFTTGPQYVRLHSCKRVVYLMRSFDLTHSYTRRDSFTAFLHRTNTCTNAHTHTHAQYTHTNAHVSTHEYTHSHTHIRTHAYTQEELSAAREKTTAFKKAQVCACVCACAFSCAFVGVHSG